jgi:hypothetical protein
MDPFRFPASLEVSKFEDAPPMPDHWRIGEGTRFPRLKTVLLFIGVGRRTTEEFWARSYPGSPFYQPGRDEMKDRIAHINIVVSNEISVNRVYEFHSQPLLLPFFAFTQTPNVLNV